jgi:O-antigen/teichoic acid export membrane protein
MVSLLIPGILGPGLFGLYALIIAWVGFLIPITSLGIGAGVLYYISNKAHTFESVFSTNLIIALLIGIFNLLILFVLKVTGLINHIDSSMQFSKWCMLAASIFFQSVNYILGRAWLGDSKFDNLNTLDLLNSLLSPGILLLMLWLFGINDTFFIYISYLITSFLTLLYISMLVRKQALWNDLNLSYFKNAFQYGLKSWIGDVALKANLRLDQLILGSFFSLSALGIYSVAVRLIELIWLIPDTIGPVIFNKVAGNPDRIENIKMISRIHRIVLASCFVILVLWIIFCYMFIVPHILGNQYLDVVRIIILLAPGVFIIISSKIITKLFSATGNVIWTSNITIIGSVISVFLYLLLIPSFGMTGAAIASTIGYICLALAGWIVLMMLHKVRFREFLAVNKSDISWIKAQWATLFSTRHPIPKER